MSEESGNGKSKSKARRAGQIIERGPDKYLLRIYQGRDSSRKRHYHDETFHGKKKAAQDRLRGLLTKQKTGEPLKLGNDTFNVFLDEFLDSKTNLKESSRRHYATTLNYYVRPELGGRLLTKIEAADIQALYKSLSEETGLGRGTLNYVFTLLRMAFKLALKRRKIVFNPMDGVELPSAKKLAEEVKVKREARTMTPAQVLAFLQAADETRFGCLFSLAFFTGCRPGEMLGLMWSDYDATARKLTIRQTINWRPGAEWYLDTPKTAHGRRVLRLTEDQIEMMAGHRRRQLEERMKMGRAWNDHGFIFANEIGEPHSQSRLRYFFKQILKAADLPLNFNPYSARHTAATLLMSSGINAKTVSERMGHADVRITLQTYTHPTDEMQIEASEEIERLIGRRN